MNELLPKLVKQKIDLENEIYGLQSHLRGKDQSQEGLRRSIDALTARHREIGEQLTGIKDALEQLSNSPDFDQGKATQVKKVFAECRILEQLLQRSYSTTLDKLKLHAAKKSLNAGPGVIQMDEKMQQKFMQLSEQEELVDDANAKGDKAITIGNSILENLHSQSLKSKSILGSLGGITRELKLSKWTAGAINRRLQADKRLIVALFLAAMAVVVLAKFVIKRLLR